jgi:glycosyltransferase involved in cell wall biosynthesis
LQELGAAPDRILIQPRGIDVEQFRPASQPLPGAACSAIVTRSLFPEYGHTTILEAVAAVIASGREVRLDIAGDGVEMPALRKLASRLGIADHVRFLGLVSHSALPEHLRGSALYLSMSRTEGLSASLIEAMASGCFPIVSDLPANRELIDEGRNGFLVPVDQPSALADAILRAMEDPALRRTAAGLNVSWVRSHADARTNQAAFVHAYRALVARTRNAPAPAA